MAGIFNCFADFFGRKREDKAPEPAPGFFLSEIERKYYDVLEENEHLRFLHEQDQQEKEARALRDSQTNPNGPSGCRCRNLEDVCIRCQNLADSKLQEAYDIEQGRAKTYREQWHATEVKLGREQQKSKRQLDAQEAKSKREYDALDAELKRLQDMVEGEQDEGLRDASGKLLTESDRYFDERDKADENRRMWDDERKLRYKALSEVTRIETVVDGLKHHIEQLEHNIEDLKRVAEANHKTIVDGLQSKLVETQAQLEEKEAKLDAKDRKIMHLYEGVSEDPVTDPSTTPSSSVSARPTLPEFKELFSASSNPLCTAPELTTSPTSSAAATVMHRRETTRSAKCNPQVIKRECSRLVRDSHFVYAKGLKNVGGPSIVSGEKRSSRPSSLHRFIKDIAKLSCQRTRATQQGYSGGPTPCYQTTYGTSPW